MVCQLIELLSMAGARCLDQIKWTVPVQRLPGTARRQAARPTLIKFSQDSLSHIWIFSNLSMCQANRAVGGLINQAQRQQQQQQKQQHLNINLINLCCHLARRLATAARRMATLAKITRANNNKSGKASNRFFIMLAKAFAWKAFAKHEWKAHTHSYIHTHA